MLWVLKKNLLNEHPKQMLKLMGKKNIYTFTPKDFAYLNLWKLPAFG